jgi:serine/threonine protein kinase
MTDLTGGFLGPYRILEQIGHGGMATIYKAYQPAMDRLVAIKVLHPNTSHDPHVVERFEHEARVIAGLEHRNIVPVYDFGREGEQLYLVLRYVRAGTVSDLLKRGPLPLADAASLLTDVASALDYAHNLNIIHRDIKPNNILVDVEGHAYLTDFGLAKVMGENLELTLSGAAIGTPAYMAPEQIAGQKVTPQTDVYALGVTLYEMLTGQLPFKSESPMAVAMMHLREPLRPPQEINPAIPAAAEAVIKRAMAKNMADRYWSAGEMASDLAGAVAVRMGSAQVGTNFMVGGIPPGGESKSAEYPAEEKRERTLCLNRKPHLAEMANEIALAKGPEEVTPEVRRELQRLERDTRRQVVLARVPWITAGLLVLVLIVSLSVTIRGLAESRIFAEETATAVQLLLFQLSDAQTAIAEGDPGSQATLAYLQTQLAGIAITGTPPTEWPTSTQRTPIITPSATLPPVTHTQRSNSPATGYTPSNEPPTTQPSSVPTKPPPAAVATPALSSKEPTVLNPLEPVPVPPPADEVVVEKDKDKEKDKDLKPTKEK